MSRNDATGSHHPFLKMLDPVLESKTEGAPQDTAHITRILRKSF